MKWAIQSAALDELARAELRNEWERHRGVWDHVSTAEMPRALEEFERHMDVVTNIMRRLAARKRAPG